MAVTAVGDTVEQQVLLETQLTFLIFILVPVADGMPPVALVLLEAGLLEEAVAAEQVITATLLVELVVAVLVEIWTLAAEKPDKQDTLVRTLITHTLHLQALLLKTQNTE